MESYEEILESLWENSKKPRARGLAFLPNHRMVLGTCFVLFLGVAYRSEFILGFVTYSLQLASVVCSRFHHGSLVYHILLAHVIGHFSHVTLLNPQSINCLTL